MFSAEQIRSRMREMGLEIARDLGAETRQPLYVAVLKGACMFHCDLARATPLDVELDFLSVSSYGSGTTSSGNVRMMMDLRADIAGRHVVLCEGVVDSGQSVSFILDLLRSRGSGEPAGRDVARQGSVPQDHGAGRLRGLEDRLGVRDRLRHGLR